MARHRSSSEDLIARAQEEIRARLAEIEPLVAEKDRLERALEALEATSGSEDGPGRSRSAGSHRRSSPATGAIVRWSSVGRSHSARPASA